MIEVQVCRWTPGPYGKLQGETMPTFFDVEEVVAIEARSKIVEYDQTIVYLRGGIKIEGINEDAVVLKNRIDGTKRVIQELRKAGARNL